MNKYLVYSLKLYDTDVDGAMYRFSGDEALYALCLEKFLDDGTVDELARALEEKRWDDAFTAAHALKGLAGNMGFIPLFHATAELVILIRAGRVSEIDGSFRELKRCYYEIYNAIYHSLRDGAGKEGATI